MSYIQTGNNLHQTISFLSSWISDLTYIFFPNRSSKKIFTDFSTHSIYNPRLNRYCTCHCILIGIYNRQTTNYSNPSSAPCRSFLICFTWTAQPVLHTHRQPSTLIKSLSIFVASYSHPHVYPNYCVRKTCLERLRPPNALPITDQPLSFPRYPYTG